LGQIVFKVAVFSPDTSVKMS